MAASVFPNPKMKQKLVNVMVLRLEILIFSVKLFLVSKVVNA